MLIAATMLVLLTVVAQAEPGRHRCWWTPLPGSCLHRHYELGRKITPDNAPPPVVVDPSDPGTGTGTGGGGTGGDPGGGGPGNSGGAGHSGEHGNGGNSGGK